MLLTLASAAGLPVTLPKQSARPRKAKSEFNNNVVPRRGAPKESDPALLAADSRERGVFEALGLTLAGLAASAVLAGAASAHDVIEDFVTSALVFSSLSSSVFSFSIK